MGLQGFKARDVERDLRVDAAIAAYALEKEGTEQAQRAQREQRAAEREARRTRMIASMEDSLMKVCRLSGWLNPAGSMANAGSVGEEGGGLPRPRYQRRMGGTYHTNSMQFEAAADQKPPGLMQGSSSRDHGWEPTHCG